MSNTETSAILWAMPAFFLHGTLNSLLENGGTRRADTVIVGIGVEPADGLARAAGIEVERGIVLL